MSRQVVMTGIGGAWFLLVYASVRAQGSQVLVFVGEKSRRLDIACVSCCSVEASLVPKKWVNLSLTVARGTGLTNTESSASVLVEVDHSKKKLWLLLSWAVGLCVISQIPVFLHIGGLCHQDSIK